MEVRWSRGPRPQRRYPRWQFTNQPPIVVRLALLLRVRVTLSPGVILPPSSIGSLSCTVSPCCLPPGFVRFDALDATPFRERPPVPFSIPRVSRYSAFDNPSRTSQPFRRLHANSPSQHALLRENSLPFFLGESSGREASTNAAEPHRLRLIWPGKTSKVSKRHRRRWRYPEQQETAPTDRKT